MPSGSPSCRLSEIAAEHDLTLRGEDADIDGVGTLSGAGPRQITFLANPGYRAELPATRAAAVILREDDAAACPTRCLVAADPYLAFARVARRFQPEESTAAGVHESAHVDPTAQLGNGVGVAPGAVVGPGCEVGDGTLIGPGTVLEAGARVGRDCRLHANVSLGRAVRLGDRVIVHPGAVIGADGFGIAFATDHWEKVPQMGSVLIGDDCEIGANTTIDRGAIEDTVLEDDVRVDNLVQIAHNVRIGAHTAIAAMAGIAGSARIGRYCLLAAGVGVLGHVEIADRVTVGARSAVLESIAEPGATWAGIFPARPQRQWQRSVALIRRLEDIWRRLRVLEKTNRTKGPESE